VISRVCVCRTANLCLSFPLSAVISILLLCLCLQATTDCLQLYSWGSAEYGRLGVGTVVSGGSRQHTHANSSAAGVPMLISKLGGRSAPGTLTVAACRDVSVAITRSLDEAGATAVI
jgi:hypothetical protein